MDQKQYDDMATIMQFGRLFATAMRRAMKNCGLLDKGFFLSVSSEDIVGKGKDKFVKYRKEFYALLSHWLKERAKDIK